MKRIPITVDEAAQDPTNVYEIRVSGDTAIASVKIHGEGKGRWLYTQYANGGSSSGTPAHWPAFVRYVEDEAPAATFQVGDVVEFVSEFHGTCTAPVTRVWANGRYVTVTLGHRTFVRLNGDVRLVMRGNGNG